MMWFATLFVLLKLVTAMRRHLLEENQAEIQIPLRDPSLVDVTDMVRELDAAGALRCCCDAPKHSAMHWHAMSEHSGRCSVDFRAGGRCRDVGRNGRPWQIGRMHHYTSTGSWCRIAPEERETVVRSIGRLNPSFCEEAPQDNETGLVLVPAAHLDEVVSVACMPGFRVSSPEVQCMLNATSGVNYLDPAPQCDRIPDYCSAMEAGTMSIVAAGVGDVVEVSCAYRTLHAPRATCGEDAAYRPEPACPELPEDATSRAVAAESTGAGRCCCDLEATGLWGWLDSSTARTGHCQIYEGLRHCKSIPGAARLVHYTRTEEQLCTILH